MFPLYFYILTLASKISTEAEEENKTILRLVLHKIVIVILGKQFISNLENISKDVYTKLKSKSYCSFCFSYYPFPYITFVEAYKNM